MEKGTNILLEHARKRLEFNPSLKRVDLVDRRFYKFEEEYYPSVTTILQYMPKGKFFETWIREMGPYSEIVMRKAGDEGTQVHNAIEELVLGKEVEWINEYGNAKYSVEVWEMILKFYEFWTTHKPELLSSEKFLYSKEYKYAGTADLLLYLNDQVWLLDIKTSNALHRSYDAQLSAYAHSFKEIYDIDVERTGILWLKASTRGPSTKKDVMQGKGWQVKPVDNIEENFQLFKFIYEIYKLDNEEVEPLIKTYPTSLKL